MKKITLSLIIISSTFIILLLLRTVESDIQGNNRLPILGFFLIIMGGGILVYGIRHYREEKNPKTRRFCPNCGWLLLEPSGICKNCAKREIASAAATSSQ